MKDTNYMNTNRIDRLFKERKREVLSVYLTAGFPELGSTLPLIRVLQENGADMVEIGMPFSDPLADGPVIQQSSQTALQNGMTLRLLFEQLKDIRKDISIPLVLMGYLNPVLQFGMESFLRNCRDAGIDGLILPDLPLREFEEQYLSLFREFGIHLILLVTPQTGEERVRKIAGLSGGFLYMVAASSTTGKKATFSKEQVDYFRRIKDMNLDIPRLIGFGISDHEGLKHASEWADGAIIGSAFIRALQEKGDPAEQAAAFIRKIRKGED